MARDKRDEPLWDPEDAIGVVPNESAYRWVHGWTSYVAVMCGLLGVVALAGAVSPFSVVRTLGALGILSGVLTIRLADKASRTNRRALLLWSVVTVGAAIGGAALWLSTA